MKQITGSVQGQNVIIDKSVLPVQGTDGLYKLKLTYDDTWGAVDTKIITFTNGGTHIAVEDTGEEDGVTIPWEVLQASPTNCGFVTIGVIGYAGTTLKITTTSVYKRNQLIVLPEVFGLSSAMTPTPDVYQKLTQGLADALTAIENANAKIGSLASLNTEDKSNLVAAINEVLSQIGTGSGTVKAVNNIEPDEEGNVTLTAENVGAATPEDVAEATAGKQDALDSAQLTAVNSGIDSAKVAQIDTNATDIDAVEEKIPAQATPQNQLADKAFVNSSVATNTANYISDNGQPFSSLADLEAYSGTLTNNDYAFVVGIDAAGNTTYTRYKYIASTQEWAEEYVLNNSSFTADQWAALNSAITSGLVAKLQDIEAGAEVNTVESISVNGTVVTPDASKNVDLTIPDGIKTLTTEDYNYPTSNPTAIAPWLLPDGFYKMTSGMSLQYSATTVGAVLKDVIIIVLSTRETNAAKLVFLPARNNAAAGYTCYTLSSSGSINSNYDESILTGRDVVNNLNAPSVYRPLSAAQGHVLNEKIDGRIGQMAGAPTTSTVGTIGTLLEDTTNGALYQLKSIDTSVTPNTYNWEVVGGGSGGGIFLVEFENNAGSSSYSTQTATEALAAYNSGKAIVFYAKRYGIFIPDNYKKGNNFQHTRDELVGIGLKPYSAVAGGLHRISTITYVASNDKFCLRYEPTDANFIQVAKETATTISDLSTDSKIITSPTLKALLQDLDDRISTLEGN